MTSTEWGLLIVAALVLGAVAGGWVAMRMLRKGFDARLRRVAEELKHKHAATADKLRAAQAQAQAELDKSRAAFKRQLAVMTAEPRAAQERAEERLKAAYAEIDRLRGHTAQPSDTGSSDLADGFAVTRPMREGM